MPRRAPNTEGKYVIGIDIGGTNVRAGLVNFKGKVLADARKPSRADEGMRVTVEMAIEATRELLAKKNLKSQDICGIGIAIAGVLRSEEGICIYSPNFAGPWPVDILGPVETALDIPAYMLNDANAATAGEHRFGAGKGYDYMVMITLGTGIGGGAVVDGKLRIGPTEGFAEVGHQILDPNGPQCGCGNHGCWEALSGRDPIIRRAVFALQQGGPSILFDLAEKNLDNITPALITQAAEKGDELALDVLDETAFWIGIGCCNLITVYNPQILVIGGGVAGALPFMMPTIQRVIDTRSRIVPASTCKIVPAKLGGDAGIIGGATLILERMEAGR